VHVEWGGGWRAGVVGTMEMLVGSVICEGQGFTIGLLMVNHLAVYYVERSSTVWCSECRSLA